MDFYLPCCQKLLLAAESLHLSFPLGLCYSSVRNEYCSSVSTLVACVNQCYDEDLFQNFYAATFD